MYNNNNNNNNQNHGITRKNMIKRLINTNKIKNSGQEYDSRMIINLINNYNNYSKKVIHNIISNILNKEVIEDYEYNAIEDILDTIFKNIQNVDNDDKDLLYIDTILFIIDKLFLYGSIDNDNKNDILDKIYIQIKDMKGCFPGIISYINFYEESLKKNYENQITETIPKSETGNGNRNGNGNGNGNENGNGNTYENDNENDNEDGNEFTLKTQTDHEDESDNENENENKIKNQGMNEVNLSKKIIIADIKKNNILKIAKEYILDKNVKNYFTKILGYDNFNSERKRKINEKISKTKNFLFQVLGYTKINNIMSIVLFENITKVLCLSDLKYIENKLPYIEIINIKNIGTDSKFNISRNLDEKFITKSGNKNTLTIKNNTYNLKNTSSF